MGTFVRSLHHGMKLLFLFVIAALVCATFAATLQEKKKDEFEVVKGDWDKSGWDKLGFGVSWDKNPTEKKKNDFRPHFRVSGFRGGDNKFEDWRRRGKRNKMQIKPFDVKGDNK